MFPAGTIARWLAAMIVMIIAHAVPSTAHAHAGHDHGVRHAAHHGATVVVPVHPAAVSEAIPGHHASIGAGDTRAAGMPGTCCCCAATCCAPAILSGPVVLAGPGTMHAVLRPGDARAGTGPTPESPIEPPRPLA